MQKIVWFYNDCVFMTWWKESIVSKIGILPGNIIKWTIVVQFEPFLDAVCVECMIALTSSNGTFDFTTRFKILPSQTINTGVHLFCLTNWARIIFIFMRPQCNPLPFDDVKRKLNILLLGLLLLFLYFHWFTFFHFLRYF